VSMPQIPDERQLALPSVPQRGRAATRRPVQRIVAAAVGAVFGYLGASGRLPLAGPHAFWFFLVGFLAALGVANLLLAVLARPSGLAVVWASVGAGRWAGSAVSGGKLLTFRWTPLIPFMACLIVVDRPGLRRRLWAGTAVAVGAELVAGAALVAAGGPAVAALGWGVVVMTALASFVNPGTVGSRAWILLRLPFTRHWGRLAELVHEPGLVPVARALSAGQVAAARSALEAAGPADSPRYRWTRAALALAEGRYAEAAQEAYAVYEACGLPETRQGALTLYARALADGAAAAVWRRDQVQPAFAATLAALRADRPALVRVTDLGAIEALLHDDPVRGAKLARYAAAVAPDAVSRAHALVTLSMALAWTGDTAAATDAARRATRLAPGLRHPALPPTPSLHPDGSRHPPPGHPLPPA
jgi:hypothetical protein